MPFRRRRSPGAMPIAAVSASVLDHFEDQHRPDKARAYTAALAINLLLNGSWTWLFFNRHRLGASAVAAAALTASSADLTRRGLEARSTRAAPLTLYPLWCAFATLLSTRIWWLNR
jgi:tryptophan-rich sensory protein